jgi:hypothetical protein
MAQIIICAGISVIPYIRPVGTFQLANVLRQSGYTVQVIDQYPWVAHLGLDVVKQLLDKFVGPDTLWIGYSSTWFRKIEQVIPHSPMAWHLPSKSGETPGNESLKTNTLLFTDEEIHDLRAFVHKKNPNVKFVLGGARSPKGRIALFSPLVDIYIEGYADNTVLRLSKYLEGKIPSLDAKPVKYGGKEIPDVYMINDDVKAESFDYNNFKFSWHDSDLVNWGETLPMEIARGCIFNCAFCSYPLNGRKKMDYLKDPLILREQIIENYERFGTTNYFFLDDTFNESVDKLEILAEHTFSKLDFRPRFGAFMRADLIAHNPRQIQLLADIGVSGAFFGIESLNYEANKSVGKGIKKDKLYDSLWKIKEEWPDDVVTDSQFIMGLPNDSEETIEEWVKELLHPDFPLDAAKIEPLALDKDQVNSTWVSSFAKYPDRYGYSFPDDTKPYHWVNNMNFSSNDAQALKIKMAKEWKVKDKPAWVGDYGLMNVGVPADVIEARKKGTRFDGKDRDRRISFVKEYIRKLLELPEG